ncbi:restriction endonuclease subunit S [Maribacter sp. MJ134]|uniref:restriction endonuclease subunit S n=1 Tax=Maribacter sp. MJ134 TaxID=2496865 RepID=UPI000F827278|nr:restriction endonuclease subunit S [Maribacter sp. MJ134]AZQ59865.1 restriction endonuclease subunit S [Maribacter sp. MJ134]
MNYSSIVDLINDKISGEWGKPSEKDNDVFVIRTTNFTNSGKINFSDIVKRNIDENKVFKKHLVDGDIIIEKSGGTPNKPVGRVVYFEDPANGTYLTNNFTAILRPNPNKAFPKYLLYALLNNHLRGKTFRFQNKTTGIANLKLDNYLKTKIFLPKLEDQKRIAQVLTDCEELIAKRKESIALLDELLKSTFLEMFGDPVKNEKGWKTKRLNRFGNFKNGLNFSKNEKGHIIKSLGVSEFKSLSTIYKTESLPTISVFKYPSKDYFLKNGDLVFVRSNGNKKLVGRCIAIYPNDENVTFSGFCIRFRLKSEKLNSIYLTYLFKNENFKNRMLSKGRGANITNLNQTILGNLEVVLPPIDMQKDFELKVHKIEDLIKLQKEHLKQLQNLYGRLGQDAFKGELDLSKVVLREEFSIIKEVNNIPEVHKSEEQSKIVYQDKITLPPITDEEAEDIKWEKFDPDKPLKLRIEDVSSEFLAGLIKERFRKHHFSMEMLVKCFEEEHKMEISYYSSEQLKKKPYLHERQDLKKFIFSAITSSNQSNLNPFLKLEQVFYDAQKENFDLKLSARDYKVFKEKDAYQRSGIYFKIVE